MTLKPKSIFLNVERRGKRLLISEDKTSLKSETDIGTGIGIENQNLEE